MSFLKQTVSIQSFVAKAGDKGATVEEIAHGLGYTPQQVGLSLSHLQDSLTRRLRPSGARRQSGLIGFSDVWIAA